MLDQRPILREWLLATSVFALIILAGATSLDLLLTNGMQWGADPVSAPPIQLAGTW